MAHLFQKGNAGYDWVKENRVGLFPVIHDSYVSLCYMQPGDGQSLAGIRPKDIEVAKYTFQEMYRWYSLGEGVGYAGLSTRTEMDELESMINSEVQKLPHIKYNNGFLLGYSDPERGIHVLEATDSGYRDVIHEAGSFQYDFAYEEHVCSILCGLYQPPLQLVGVWHKHNSVHSGNTIPFSGADEDMHRQLMENDCPCISILFEKCSAPDETVRYKAGVFLLSVGGAHRNITDSTVWGESLCDEPLTEIHGVTIDS